MSTKEEQYKKAKKRVEAKKGFYGHFGSFIAVMAFLFLLNIFTSYGKWWVIYPFLGWGVSVVIHYFSVFGLPFINHGDDWEEEAIRREMEKDTKKWNEDDLV